VDRRLTCLVLVQESATMVRIAYMTGLPEDEAVYSFATSDEYGEWSLGVGDIKSRIRSINNDGRAGPPVCGIIKDGWRL